MNWVTHSVMPMNLAPKDGTEVDLFFKDGSRVPDCRWIDDKGECEPDPRWVWMVTETTSCYETVRGNPVGWCYAPKMEVACAIDRLVRDAEKAELAAKNATLIGG